MERYHNEDLYNFTNKERISKMKIIRETIGNVLEKEYENIRVPYRGKSGAGNSNYKGYKIGLDGWLWIEICEYVNRDARDNAKQKGNKNEELQNHFLICCFTWHKNASNNILDHYLEFNQFSIVKFGEKKSERTGLKHDEIIRLELNLVDDVNHIIRVLLNEARNVLNANSSMHYQDISSELISEIESTVKKPKLKKVQILQPLHQLSGPQREQKIADIVEKLTQLFSINNLYKIRRIDSPLSYLHEYEISKIIDHPSYVKCILSFQFLERDANSGECHFHFAKLGLMQYTNCHRVPMHIGKKTMLMYDPNINICDEDIEIKIVGLFNKIESLFQ